MIENPRRGGVLLGGGGVAEGPGGSLRRIGEFGGGGGGGGLNIFFRGRNVREESKGRKKTHNLFQH